jgi:hypothetical protein
MFDYLVFYRFEGISLTDSAQFHIAKMLKNSNISLEGLWLGNIWQILATSIAQEIPPK